MRDNLDHGRAPAEPGRRLTREQLDWVLERAVEIDAVWSTDEFSEDDVYTLGAELGVAPGSIRRALDDFTTLPDEHSSRGPAAVAVGVVDGPVERIVEAVEAGLRRRSMDRCRLYGSSCWHQRRDWWPDIKRFGFAPAVHVDVRPRGQASLVRLRTPVGLLRWLYVVWTALAVVVVAAMVGLTLHPLAAISTGAATALGGWVAYRRRVDAIQWRLAVFVDELIRPNERLTGFDTAGQTRPEMVAAERSVQDDH